MSGQIEYFELDDIWDCFIGFFQHCIEWLFTHGFTVYGYSINFGEMLITIAILNAVFWVFLPWFEDFEEDENNVE